LGFDKRFSLALVRVVLKPHRQFDMSFSTQTVRVSPLRPIAAIDTARALPLFAFVHVRERFHVNSAAASHDSDANERDVELLRRIASGDREAFAEFYDRHAALMYSVASKILGNNNEAQDVLQDVCLQIWEKAGRFDPALGRAASWAAILARNRAVARMRASQRRTRLADEAGREHSTIAGPATASVNDTVYGGDRAAEIKTVIQQLPEEQRLAIELAYFSGLTQDEISQKLNTPLGTIKARIRRGLLKLRDQLEELP